MAFEDLRPALEAARSRYLSYLAGLNEEQLSWRAAPGSNSIGFLIRHIAEVEYRYCQMFFDQTIPSDVEISTIGEVTDLGTYRDLPALQTFMEASYAHLLASLSALPQEKWDIPVQAPIAVLTPREALGRLIFHTGYHAGQIGLIRKYGGAS